MQFDSYGLGMSDARMNLRYVWLSIGWIVLLTVVRIVYSQSFLLTPDETNYWQWSRHLAWGYHDQAPMIAWAIRISTVLLGHSELAVRLPSVLSMTVASIYLMLLARHWFNDKTAWQATLIAQSVLIFNVGGVLATADGLQGASWIGAVYHASRALETGRWRPWAISGFWFGFGLLSKYTVVLFLPCILAYVIFTPRHRKHLRSIKPYLCYGLGGVMFLPVVAWNAANNWNSVRHVAFIGGVNEPFRLHLNYLMEFIASQAGLLSPLVFCLVIWGWTKILRKQYVPEQWIFSFLCWTSLPIIAGFTLLNLHSRVYANWPCFGYLTTILIVSACFSTRHAASQQADDRIVAAPSSLWRWTLGSSYALTAVILLQVIFPILPIPAKWDRIADETQGWRPLGQYVAGIHDTMPAPQRTFIFGMTYQIASEMAFYVPGQPDTVSINRWHRPNVYEYWWRDQDLIGRDAVGCLENKRDMQRLQQIFDRVEAVDPFHVYRKLPFYLAHAAGKPNKTFYLFRCFGFKGGMNWMPPAATDVRQKIERFPAASGRESSR